MARLSKTTQFAIYEDGCIPAPDTAERRSLDDTSGVEDKEGIATEESEDRRSPISNDGEDAPILEVVQEQERDEGDADDERRESTLTAVSISSLPESAYETDHDLEILGHNPSTPPIIRPIFRQIESIQRLQIKSAPHFGSRSPRRSLLYHFRSRTGTPRSARSGNARGSPRPRKRISETTEAPEEEQKHYPLVLLHVTLLPVNLPWSTESMQELLPANVLENLQLIRSKVSETVLNRGILIPHPREEYELLEERLLEALELQDERVTKCGHFRNRESSSESDNGGDSDSGVGSSVDGSDGELCATCQHHIKTLRTPTGGGSKKWSIRIFAANGLMRASAWTAAWTDMESVDVEVLPWISEDVSRKLDERREQVKGAAEAEREEEEEERIRRIVEEHVWHAREELKRSYEVDRSTKENATAETLKVPNLKKEAAKEELAEQCLQGALPRSMPKDAPQIYRRSQIPVSILLKNYIYLLTKDRRNVAIFFLGMVAIFFALMAAANLKQSPLSRSEDAGFQILQPTDLPMIVQDDIARVVRRSDDSVSDGATHNLTTPNPASPVMADLETADVRDDRCMYDRYDWYFSAVINGDTCPAGLQELSGD